MAACPRLLTSRGYHHSYMPLLPFGHSRFIPTRLRTQLRQTYITAPRDLSVAHCSRFLNRSVLTGEISIALVPGMAAREVAVSALGTVYALQGDEDQGGGKALATVLQSAWPLSTALAFLAWFIYAPQCLATLATARRENQQLGAGPHSYDGIPVRLGLFNSNDCQFGR